MSSMQLLQAYREGHLQQLWERGTQRLIQANPHVSPIRCGEVTAAILAFELAREAVELDGKVRPFSMTAEEESLYDWLYVEENAHYRADLQSWSGTRTMLLDTPDGVYTPEWTQYIRVPEVQ